MKGAGRCRGGWVPTAAWASFHRQHSLSLLRGRVCNRYLAMSLSLLLFGSPHLSEYSGDFCLCRTVSFRNRGGGVWRRCWTDALNPLSKIAENDGRGRQDTNRRGGVLPARAKKKCYLLYGVGNFGRWDGVRYKTATVSRTESAHT